MKRKISVSVDDGKVVLIEKLVKKGEFRNKSHVVEKGLDMVFEFLEEGVENGK